MRERADRESPAAASARDARARVAWGVLVVALGVLGLLGSRAGGGAERGARVDAVRLVPAAAFARAAGWSRPVRIAGCALSPPQVAFPSSAPSVASGPGAIAWLAGGAGCGAGAGAASSIALTWLPVDVRSPARAATILRRPAAGLLATGTSEGRIAAVAVGASSATLAQGAAPAALRLERTLPSAGPVALAHGYLGEAAVAAVTAAPAIVITVERHYAPRFAPAMRVPIAPGAVSALSVALDFRGDALVAWQQNGEIYARLLRANGHPEPTQRVGPSAEHAQVQAIVSDDNRAMVAWSSTGAGASPRTSVHIAFSAVGVRFAGARTVASYADPGRAGVQPGSLALVRTANENVMLVWSELRAGRYVVLAAPAVYAGTRAARVVSSLGQEAVLAAVAPGTARDVVVLWRAAPAGGAPYDWTLGRLWSATAYFAAHDVVRSTSPLLAPATAVVAAPAIAVNPVDDRALLAWETPAGAIEDSEALTSVPHAAAVATTTSGGVHWLRITATVLVALAVVLAVWLLLRRRRGRRGAIGG